MEKIEKIFELLKKFQEEKKENIYLTTEQIISEIPKLKEELKKILSLAKEIIENTQNLEIEEDRKQNIIDLENVLVVLNDYIRILENLEKYLKLLTSKNSPLSGLLKLDGIILYSVLIPYLINYPSKIESEKFTKTELYDKVVSFASRAWGKKTFRDCTITSINFFRKNINEVFNYGRKTLAEFDTLFWRKNSNGRVDN